MRRELFGRRKITLWNVCYITPCVGDQKRDTSSNVFDQPISLPPPSTKKVPGISRILDEIFRFSIRCLPHLRYSRPTDSPIWLSHKTSVRVSDAILTCATADRTRPPGSFPLPLSPRPMCCAWSRESDTCQGTAPTTIPTIKVVCLMMSYIPSRLLISLWHRLGGRRTKGTKLSVAATNSETRAYLGAVTEGSCGGGAMETTSKM